MESLYFIEGQPELSVAIVVIVAAVVIFFLRSPLHKALEGLSEGISTGFGKIAEWCDRVGNKIRERDQKVLLESGIASQKHKLVDEFGRVEISFSKNLADYPGLQRRLDDHISKLEGDYRECGQTVPKAPGWNEAVTSIAKLQGSAGDRVIEKMLGEIHRSAVDGEKRALAELRTTTSKRHKILSTMAPVWKQVNKLLKDVGEKIGSVMETSERIDKYMTEFQKISKGNTESIDMLSSRANRMFIATSIVVLAAVAGAVVNFFIIQLPMSELVPSANRVLGMPVSSFSALIIILLEFVTGIFFWESVGFTHIIPQISMLPRSRRKYITYLSFTFLFLLACVEASLGFFREGMAESGQATTAILSGEAAKVAAEQIGQNWVLFGQAGLGFALPFILALTMMALENFIETGQHAAAKIGTLFFALIGSLCKLISHILCMILKVIMDLLFVHKTKHA